MYIIRGLFKHSEEDSYKDGCLPKTGQAYSVDVDFAADTIDGLVEKVDGYLGTGSGDHEKGVCDEPSRIDWQTMEDDDGTQATPEQLKLWKLGKIRLWACTYSGIVEQVTPVDLTKKL
jgi:hypothetical protein